MHVPCPVKVSHVNHIAATPPRHSFPTPDNLTVVWRCTPLRVLCLVQHICTYLGNALSQTTINPHADMAVQHKPGHCDNLGAARAVMLQPLLLAVAENFAGPSENW